MLLSHPLPTLACTHTYTHIHTHTHTYTYRVLRHVALPGVSRVRCRRHRPRWRVSARARSYCTHHIFGQLYHHPKIVTLIPSRILETKYHSITPPRDHHASTLSPHQHTTITPHIWSTISPPQNYTAYIPVPS